MLKGASSRFGMRFFANNPLAVIATIATGLSVSCNFNGSESEVTSGTFAERSRHLFPSHSTGNFHLPDFLAVPECSICGECAKRIRR
jgi:hypothetical protein